MDRKQEYADRLKDPQWQQKRLRILDRDLWQCQGCGDCRSTLHVHHIAYSRRSLAEPWTDPDDLLVTLCASCHEIEDFLHDRELYRLRLVLGQIGIRSATDISWLLSFVERAGGLSSGLDQFIEYKEPLIRIGLDEYGDASYYGVGPYRVANGGG